MSSLLALLITAACTLASFYLGVWYANDRAYSTGYDDGLRDLIPYLPDEELKAITESMEA